ncbi:retrovirus-related Pol polyprotein from transposon TNT 1-94 [Cucumis melo var. makuwa]|uniref:Retrovirus-related Pol polyprotein from transposon TNT 1-94 n=1 Tax=Cucumis melo var. makuwa TaxID=1194695 RepID=A0A5D3CT04_CUCMM|nr:retrovirus-related Pol polyprotein from transposon TNT 1-94 [Cucumis melo var. makuwa]TYK14164.1 retrovirus-related Pol polyprotein from transposon TNT 1-94 [Cucumis melo var. makuwa]
MDVTTTFLHGSLEADLYMEQPKGSKAKGKTDLVCKLKKSLYGLKQSPRFWYKRFDDFINKIGFMRSLYDPCVYYKKLTDGSLMYLLLYVDDMLLAGKNLTKLNEIREQLKNKFEMKDLGSSKRILGMEITRERRRRELFLSHKQYTKKVLAKFNMSNAKAISTPMGQQFKLSAKDSPKESTKRQVMSNVPYTNAIGSLMYLMVCTRPDLAYNSSLVTRYMGNPGRNLWEATKWVF